MILFMSFIIRAAALVKALPLMKRDVASPLIMGPAGVTIWTPGKDELVTWFGTPNGRRSGRAHVPRTRIWG